MKLRKTLACVMLAALMITGAACADNFKESREITVISREEGSGTRSAFIELFGVERKNESGEKIDETYDEAVITNSTGVCMSAVNKDAYSIGYVSMGSLNESVKAVSIDGAQASVENIQNGAYPVARPFMIAVREGDVSKLAQDFITFIQSAEGAKVIEDNGYIAVGEAEKRAYTGIGGAGKLVIAGSSSVTPVMEKLAEAYGAANPDAQIEVQQNDSTTGIMSVISGVCDIGMASRALKESELSQGLIPTTIAMDGIAVIVNLNNPVTDLTSEQVRMIFTGEACQWSEILK